MKDDLVVRTTLDTADDVLQAAKEVVEARRAPGAKRPTMKLVEDLRDEGCPDLAENHDDHFADAAGHRRSLPSS